MAKKKRNSDWSSGKSINSYQKGRTWSFKIPKSHPLSDAAKHCDLKTSDLTGREGLGLTESFSPSIHDPIAAFNYKSQAARQQKAINTMNSGLDFVRRPEGGAEYYEFCSARAPKGSWRVDRTVEDQTETIFELTSNCTHEGDYKVLNWEIYQQPSYSVTVNLQTTARSTWQNGSTILVHAWSQTPNIALVGQTLLTELSPAGGSFTFSPGADGIALSFAVRNSSKLSEFGNPFLISSYYWDTAFFDVTVSPEEIPSVEVNLLYHD